MNATKFEDLNLMNVHSFCKTTRADLEVLQQAQLRVKDTSTRQMPQDFKNSTSTFQLHKASKVINKKKVELQEWTSVIIGIKI